MTGLVAGGRRAARRGRLLPWLFGAAAVALVLGTGAAFLAPNGTAATTITPLTTQNGGAATNLVPVQTAVTVTSGRAQVIAGIELYRIDIADPTLSGRLVVEFNWVDPQDAGKVLNNPHAWIQVGLFYPSASVPPCPTGQFQVTDANNANICVQPDPGAYASDALTAAHASAVLQSTVSGQSAYYVLGAITTPGHVPQGQQGQLTGLQYFAQVRTH
jgi:hypothetical protein